MDSRRVWSCLLIATLLVVSVVTTPVAAAPGTVTSNGSSVALPGSEVTVSFEVTNTGQQPGAYILDLTLPNGWKVTEHTDDDATWSSTKSKWLWQQVGVDETKTGSVTAKIPDDATQAGAIEATLESPTGILQTTTHDIEFYDNKNQVKIANARLSPSTVSSSSTSHTLTFDAYSVSADGSPDTFKITLPDRVNLEAVNSVRTTSGTYDPSTTTTQSSIIFAADPSASTDVVNMTIVTEMQLSKASDP